MRYQIAPLVTYVHLYLEFWYLFNYFPAWLLQWAFGWFPLFPIAHLHSILNSATHLIGALSTFPHCVFFSPQVLLAFYTVIHKLEISFAVASFYIIFTLTSQHRLLLPGLATHPLSSVPHFLSPVFTSSDLLLRLLLLISGSVMPPFPRFQHWCLKAQQWSCCSLSHHLQESSTPFLHCLYNILSVPG